MRSEFTFHVNMYLALVLGLILILIDYHRKINADRILRRLLTLVIAFSLGTMLSDLIYDIAAGRPGEVARMIMLIANAIYFTSQIMAFGTMALFLDFCMRSDTKRLKKLSVIIGIVCAVNLLLVTIAILTGHIFTVMPGGYYARSDGFHLLPFLSYLIILIILADAYLCRRQINA